MIRSYKVLMYDARAVANYFIDRADRTELPLTIMTLLKVLYFAHGWHLAQFSKPLIAQPFEAWKHGPVSRVVYDQYKESGKKTIKKRAVSFDPNSMEFIETPYSFEKGTQKLLDDIFDYYAKFHPFTLSDLTHEKGGPWDEIWSGAQDRAVPGMIIPNKLILRWFESGRIGIVHTVNTGDSNDGGICNTSRA
jgi:uncharacterized phage-associated protein